MRVFSYIYAFYIMGLFIAPCSHVYEDNSLRGDDHSKEIIYERTETIDLCTPFCSCNCGVITDIVLCNSNFTEDIIFFDLSRTKIYYKSISIPLYFGEIWKPPRKVNV